MEIPKSGPAELEFPRWVDAAADALAQAGVIDRQRVGLVGFSRGGFVTYQSITHPGPIVSGDPSTLKALYTCADLAQEYRFIYQHIYDELPQVGPLRNLLETYGMIVSTPGKMTDPQGIEIPLSSFSTLSAAQPTRLIGEDLDDCKFYILVGRSTAIGALSARLPLAFEMLPGGGSRTHITYGHFKPRPGVTIALADSDRLCPDDRLGDVATQLKRVHIATPGIGYIAITETKGIENLFPKELLERAMAGHWTCALGKHGVRAMSIEEIPLKFHADLKNGLKMRRVVNWANGEPRSIFWKERYLRVRDILGDFDTTCDHAFKCVDNDGCTCWIVRPIGSGALGQVLAAASFFTAAGVWKMIDSDIRAEWERIGRIIVSWCCGSYPIYAG